jgi:hypothetical protein
MTRRLLAILGRRTVVTFGLVAESITRTGRKNHEIFIRGMMLAARVTGISITSAERQRSVIDCDAFQSSRRRVWVRVSDDAARITVFLRPAVDLHVKAGR